MRRATDFVMMVAAGLTTIVVILCGIAGFGHVAGAGSASGAGTSPGGIDHLWVMTGIGGFVLGLSWRFLFWDLPGMMWHLLMYHRTNLQYVCMLCAGVAILVFI